MFSGNFHRNEINDLIFGIVYGNQSSIILSEHDSRSLKRSTLVAYIVTEAMKQINHKTGIHLVPPSRGDSEMTKTFDQLKLPV